MRTLVARALGLTVLASLGCLGDGDDGALDVARGAIEAGQLELGYPTVGAIIAHDAGDPPEGHLCTGTLVSQSWVLTAQHCEGTSMVFKTGTSIWSDFVDHAVDLQVRHPRLDQMLIHLSTPVEGAGVLKLNEGAAPAVGTNCTAVGFGDYTPPGGDTFNGVKRSATEQVQFVQADEITVKAVTGLSAGGDSGGPLICNGVVAATVKGHIEQDGDYPARQTSIYKPVDAPWILSTIAPTWTELSLQNGWSHGAFGGRNAAYALVSGRVHLKGAISTTGTNALAFTLPAGFRPDQDVVVAVDLMLAAKGSLLIKKDGTVTVRAAGAFSSAASFTSLEGVSFVPSFFGYANLSLQNGWIGAPGASSPAAAKLGGVVRFRGAMTTTGNSSTVFTLPADLRPAAAVYVPVVLSGSKHGRLLIGTNGVATVEAETSLTDAKALTSLDGAWFAADGAGFTTMGLQNGWAPYGFGTATPGARVMHGTVHLRGALKSGTTGQAFTLPAGMRPPTNLWVPLDICGARKGRLFVNPGGAATVQSEGSFADAQCFTSLEGVSFTLSDFTPLTLENSWANAGFGVAQSGFQVSGGVVQLKGALSGGTPFTAFTLPAAARPSATVYLPTNLCDGARGRLIVGTNGAATVQVQGGDMSRASCFTDLEGLSFPTSAAGFTALALQNGWQAYGGGTRAPAVGTVNGLVRLTGAVKTAQSNGNTVPFTLPAAFRPSSTVYERVDLCNAKKGRVTINTDGSVNIGSEDVFNDAQCFTSFEGVSFPAATGSYSTLTLQNGWVSYTSRAAGVAVAPGTGVVRLVGAVSSGSSATLFTLPAGLRPLKDAYVATDLCNAKNGRLYVATSGAVSVETAGGPFSNATCFTSLEGISFTLTGN